MHAELADGDAVAVVSGEPDGRACHVIEDTTGRGRWALPIEVRMIRGVSEDALGEVQKLVGARKYRR